MATYAIGDVQGCWLTLRALLERLPLVEGRDRLWITGDLVNRGPRSLEVLRWAVERPDLVAVIGNHDLHLLSRAAGVRREKPRDTLDEVLAAPDRDRLLDWLAARPLLHREGPWVMVHAGLLPAWDLARAERLARELEALLRGPDRTGLLAGYAGGAGPEAWSEALPAAEQRLVALRAFTLLRTVREDGAMEPEFDGPPREAPPGLVPWFDAPGRAWSGQCRVVFGHWAALGLHRGDEALGLDSGCVWGGQLTALRLDDGATWQEPLRD